MLIIRGLLKFNPCHIACLREALPIGVWNLEKCPGTRTATRAAPTKSGFLVCNLPGFYVSVVGATLVVARLWSPACGRPLVVARFPCILKIRFNPHDPFDLRPHPTTRAQTRTPACARFCLVYQNQQIRPAPTHAPPSKTSSVYTPAGSPLRRIVTLSP